MHCNLRLRNLLCILWSRSRWFRSLVLFPREQLFLEFREHCPEHQEAQDLGQFHPKRCWDHMYRHPMQHLIHMANEDMGMAVIRVREIRPRGPLNEMNALAQGFHIGRPSCWRRNHERFSHIQMGRDSD